MKIEMKYTGGILNLPSTVADLAPTASETQLRVLLSIAGATQYFGELEAYFTTLTQRLDLTIDEIKLSLAFWAQNGILSIEGMEEGILQACQNESSLQNSEPTYTGKQLLAYIEKNKDFRALCNECQNVLGKLFITQDYSNIQLLKNYYKFSDEYILLLLAHCKETENDNWNYIRRLAHTLYDDGISTYSKLEEHFAARSNKKSLEYKIRKLLGIGNREFGAKEKKYILKWIEQKIPFTLIEKAYEITIDNTKNVSCSYMSKILDNWQAEGIKNVKDAEKSQEQYKNKQKLSMSTFDTDDFFEAALERSNEELKKWRKE